MEEGNFQIVYILTYSGDCYKELTTVLTDWNGAISEFAAAAPGSQLIIMHSSQELTLLKVC